MAFRNDEDEYINTSINYTNAKGYYQTLDKIILVMVENRLMRNYAEWWLSLETLATITSPFWSKPKKYTYFREQEKKIEELLSTITSNINESLKARLYYKLRLLIKECEEIVMSNISHIMIRFSDDFDDDDDWLRDDDEEEGGVKEA